MRANSKVVAFIKVVIFTLLGFAAVLLAMYMFVGRDKGEDKTEFTTYKEADSGNTDQDPLSGAGPDVATATVASSEAQNTFEEGNVAANGTTEEGAAGEITTEQVTTEDVTTESTNNSVAQDPEVEKILSGMSIHEKCCQLFMITPEALTGYTQVTEAGDTTRNYFKEYPVGGLIYFSNNISSSSQVKALLENTTKIAEETSGVPIFLGVDEEGGTVARCGDKLDVTQFKDMYEYKDLGTGTAYSNAKTIATYLKDLGFNTDFAPVADTWSNSENTVIGKRAYSDNFSETAELVSSAVLGFKDVGVVCSLKHFPGHGDTTTDTHEGAAVVEKTSSQLMQEEYLAFKSGIDAGADMVMVGHITAKAISDEPASVSKEVVTGELREKLGYDGIVITDALNMGAVSNSYSSSELGVKCVEAGVDIILMPSDFRSCLSGLEDAVNSGKISEERINESVRRILRVKLSMNKSLHQM